jgi:hypothetical protein
MILKSYLLQWIDFLGEFGSIFGAASAFAVLGLGSEVEEVRETSELCF